MSIEPEFEHNHLSSGGAAYAFLETISVAPPELQSSSGSRIPPLRERREDIPLLVEYFMEKYARRMGKQVKTVPPKTMERLVSWPWPGNVRELQNMIERGVILSRGFVLEVPMTELDQSPVPALHDNSGASTLEAFERAHILDALRDTGWVVAGAAERLGLNRSTLNARMRKLDIKRPRPEYFPHSGAI